MDELQEISAKDEIKWKESIGKNPVSAP